MKGVARTMLLLLCWGTLQRWLLGAGLVLGIGGLVALSDLWHPRFQPLFAIVVMCGLMLATISPALMGGIVFRSLSAARAMQLIPAGRLKLWVGALLSQLLLAGLVAVTVALLFTSPGLLDGAHATRPAGELGAVTFVAVYALLSVQFIGLYLLSRFPFGGLWLLGWGVWPSLAAAVARTWHLQATLASSAGLASAGALLLSGWMLFARSYLRAGRVAAPHIGSFAPFTGVRPAFRAPRKPVSARPASTEAASFSRRKALRTQLLGMRAAPLGRMARVAIYLAILLLFVVLPVRQRGYGLNPLAWVPLVICSGPAAAALALTMTQRARFLWLAAGLGRAQLFAEVERYSWWLMLIVIAICASFLVPQFVQSLSSYATAVQFLTRVLIAVSSAAAFIYAGMSWVRGHRIAGSLIAAACVACWLIDCLNTQSGALLRPSLLLGIQIIVVPVVRRLALRQWQDIDWTLNRPQRLPNRLA